MASLPHLVEMDEKYSKQGLKIIAPEVLNSSTEDILKVVEDKKMKFTVIKGIDGPPIGEGIPLMAVFDSSGKMIWLGAPMDEAAEAAIEKALEAVKAAGA